MQSSQPVNSGFYLERDTDFFRNMVGMNDWGGFKFKRGTFF